MEQVSCSNIFYFAPALGTLRQQGLFSNFDPKGPRDGQFWCTPMLLFVAVLQYAAHTMMRFPWSRLILDA